MTERLAKEKRRGITKHCQIEWRSFTILFDLDDHRTTDAPNFDLDKILFIVRQMQ